MAKNPLPDNEYTRIIDDQDVLIDLYRGLLQKAVKVLTDCPVYTAELFALRDEIEAVIGDQDE